MTNLQGRDYCGSDLERIQSLGPVAEVILRGFSFGPDVVYQSHDPAAPNYRHPEAPPITGSFPRPWQALSAAERASRAQSPRDQNAWASPAFERGHTGDAKDILAVAAVLRKELQATHERVRRENPGKSEETLGAEGKLRFPQIPPSAVWTSLDFHEGKKR